MNDVSNFTVGQYFVGEIDADTKTITFKEGTPPIDLKAEAVKKAQLELLNWLAQIMSGGPTYGMIRRLIHNKYVEISGEGEKA